MSNNSLSPLRSAIEESFGSAVLSAHGYFSELNISLCCFKTQPHSFISLKRNYLPMRERLSTCLPKTIMLRIGNAACVVFYKQDLVTRSCLSRWCLYDSIRARHTLRVVHVRDPKPPCSKWKHLPSPITAAHHQLLYRERNIALRNVQETKYDLLPPSARTKAMAYELEMDLNRQKFDLGKSILLENSEDYILIFTCSNMAAATFKVGLLSPRALPFKDFILPLTRHTIDGRSYKLQARSGCAGSTLPALSRI